MNLNNSPANAPCPCGSGQIFKYCCIALKLNNRQIIADNPASGEQKQFDFTNDLLNQAAQIRTPLKNFCKDNDIYLFSMTMTISEADDLSRKLIGNTLTKSEIMALYKKASVRERIMNILNKCCQEYSCFKNREDILFDSFSSHFDKRYTLSVPVMIIQLEGILREIGNLALGDTFKSTISPNKWDNSLLFDPSNNAKYFNGFINKFFEGSKGASVFNRNSILHGANLNYQNEENSLIIMWSILEISLFNWWALKADDFKLVFFD